MDNLEECKRVQIVDLIFFWLAGLALQGSMIHRITTFLSEKRK